jgi:hypothetical protein
MADTPSPEETALWQRRLAAQANNRAWKLAESVSRTPEEDEEMLQAANAAMFFWKIVGNEGNRAHAAQLLAHVYALLRLPNPANHYWAKSKHFFLDRTCEPWEKALAFAIQSNVAAASGQSTLHQTSYREAEKLIAALPDPEDREILEATLNVIPKPRTSV